jgi:hypothetical protein
MLATTLLALVLAAAAAPAGSPPPPRLPANARSPAAERAPGPSLSRRSDGSLEHKDRVAGFAATIHSDGRVTFRDLAPVKVDSPTILGFDLRGRPGRPPDERFNEKSNSLVHRGTTTDSKNDPLVKWGPYGAPPIMGTFGGSFPGVADFASSTRRASAKQRFLDQTADLRAKMAAEHRRNHEKAALGKLATDLQAIWADAATPISLRKERIFLRWDECEEMLVDAGEGASESEPEQAARARAGVIARRRIEAFVRKQAPRGSADAFTAAELREMNARRRSRARFDPYGERAPAVGPTKP